MKGLEKAIQEMHKTSSDKDLYERLWKLCPDPQTQEKFKKEDPVKATGEKAELNNKEETIPKKNDAESTQVEKEEEYCTCIANEQKPKELIATLEKKKGFFGNMFNCCGRRGQETIEEKPVKCKLCGKGDKKNDNSKVVVDKKEKNRTCMPGRTHDRYRHQRYYDGYDNYNQGTNIYIEENTYVEQNNGTSWFDFGGGGGYDGGGWGGGDFGGGGGWGGGDFGGGGDF